MSVTLLSVVARGQENTSTEVYIAFEQNEVLTWFPTNTVKRRRAWVRIVLGRQTSENSAHSHSYRLALYVPPGR